MNSTALRGRSVLLVEDELALAMDLQARLEDVGASILGPVGQLDAALRLAGESQRIDIAILDVNLQGERVYPLADLLRKRGIPFVFATGYARSMLPKDYQRETICEKPVDFAVVSSIVIQELDRIAH